MPTEQSGLAPLQKLLPETTLAYYKTRRAANGNKRNYVFDYGKSKTCEHTNLRALARGGIVYRCMDCNYAFHIPGGYQQPMHNEAILAAFTLFNFSKEFGMDALGEVLRSPIGQSDGTAHKPVLPEGMSFTDVLELLDQIDVTTEDGGAKQLYAAIDEVWVDAGQRARRLKELEGINKERRPELGPAYDPDAILPSLQEGGSDALPDGSQGKS
jgi:hypothetical protein